MRPPDGDPPRDDGLQPSRDRLIGGFLDADWYKARYPDIAAGDIDPCQHFIRYGAAEKRDPNRFFDSAWYVEHNSDVAASGLNPLLHYAQAGAAELRNPHPRFDAVYYVEQHPDAASNPLLYHLRVGLARGYLTEKPIDIRDYLPSENPALPLPNGVFADVVIPVHREFQDAACCIRSVLADRALPLARIIVIDDRSPEAELIGWLRDLADEGQIYLIRNRRHLGFDASAKLGIDAAEDHDVVLLNSDTGVPAGCLRRLVSHAYAHPNVATVSPLWDHAAIDGYRQDGQTSAQIDDLCRTINAGRSADVPVSMDHCVYIRRAALLAVGVFDQGDFSQRATAAGWRHRLACDTFVRRSERADTKETVYAAQASILPYLFAVTAGLCRQAQLPVILMITHDFGGGVRRHIDGLVERYRETARILVLEGTDRGTTLSVPSLPDHPLLKLPADRLDDLVTVLRSANLSRIHIHHLLRMDMDIRALVHRLRVPFDVTVHDYYAICPQVNLLRWEEGLY
ncbi:MAG: glycosyltransferase, partial [Pseudomonadota bacterium]|nr:glycosyltransferase [Pseudomonadota bacterium]